jgi:pyridoxamine 5'-phosphate oxidase
MTARIQTTDLRARLRAVPTLTGTAPSFDPAAAPEDPSALFVDWLLTAIDQGVPEPTAMTLSTTDAAGTPSARVLILKNVDETGWQFATNSTSRKGLELAERPVAALAFYWVPMARQVRITGTVQPAAPDDSGRDFLARSESARATALVGRQSQPLGSQTDLQTALATAAAQVNQDPTTIAPAWTLYTLRADEVEFWQADPDRRHLRLQYTRTDSAWTRTLLWP